jgi:hypothetical protein
MRTECEGDEESEEVFAGHAELMEEGIVDGALLQSSRQCHQRKHM